MKNPNLYAEAQSASLSYMARRHFLRTCGLSLGGMALGHFMGSCTPLPNPSTGMPDLSATLSPKIDPIHPFLPRPPHFAPKAKAVIYIHAAGAPSQLELFDYKPELTKMDGQDCPASLLEGKKFAFIRGVPKMLGQQAQFRQYGQSGAWVSDFMPHLQTVVDELCFLKGVTTDQFNHAPAQLLMHTGVPRLGRPSLGAWVTYGLGSENQNLPAFVVLTSGGKDPDAGKSVWGSGFLPSVFQGVQCRSEGDPVLFLNDPKGMSRDLRRASIDAINAINQLQYEQVKDPETISRIAQYEMAFKMQMSVPEAMDMKAEPTYIHQMYGTTEGKSSFANNCLLARKLVEKGVRFVQLFDWGWDTHGTGEDLSIDIGLVNKCRQTDKATTALILDLKQRGLLDDTLVIWGGEFGRTPMLENRENKPMPFKGRDHHTEAFTIWMAGGGVKQGFTHGETDEIGYATIKGKVSTYDIQATILHQLGFDHTQLTYHFQGRPFRLTDVHGQVIRDII